MSTHASIEIATIRINQTSLSRLRNIFPLAQAVLEVWVLSCILYLPLKRLNSLMIFSNPFSYVKVTPIRMVFRMKSQY